MKENILKINFSREDINASKDRKHEMAEQISMNLFKTKPDTIIIHTAPGQMETDDVKYIINLCKAIRKFKELKKIKPDMNVIIESNRSFTNIISNEIVLSSNLFPNIDKYVYYNLDDNNEVVAYKEYLMSEI